MNHFDLNLMRTFIEVYRHSSFTIAAENIGISQPGVSGAIRKMEQNLGYQLFVKQGRGIQPTAAAHKLAKRTQQAYDEITNALSDTEQFNVFVTEALIHIVSDIEDINLEEMSVDQHTIIQSLRNQSLDMAISVFTVNDPSLEFEPIFEEEPVVVCRKGHPNIGEELSVEKFYELGHVVLATKWEKLYAFEHGALEPVKERNIKLKVGSKSAMLLHVASSDHIAVLSKSLATRWAEVLDLHIIECPVRLRQFPYRLAYHKRHLSSESHQAMRNTLKAAFN
ncbi:LysR family transcriptional regulator [Vibrio variabilis]|uniref:LysR family transcriptional regulator n=1 Tax=Vibrio variabilis TaxID=990271 RepID=UPI000DDA1068|nr:LysR family transcriptional regulator [Vibrio variabilis]